MKPKFDTLDKLIGDIHKKVDKLVEQTVPVKDVNYVSVTENYYVTTEDEGAADRKNHMVGTMDIGTPDTASGEKWVNDYINTNKLDWNNLNVEKSSKAFKFGNSMPSSALNVVKLPFFMRDMGGEIGKMELRVHIVKNDIPLLIGKDAHKEYNMMTIPAQSQCKFGGRTYRLVDTASGHWGLQFVNIGEVTGKKDDKVLGDNGEESECEEFFDAEEDIGEDKEHEDKDVDKDWDQQSHSHILTQSLGGENGGPEVEEIIRRLRERSESPVRWKRWCSGYGCTYMVGDHHCNNDCYDLYGNYMVDVQGRGRIRVCDRMAGLKDMSEHMESAHGLKIGKIFADGSKEVAEICKETLDEKIKDGSVDDEKPGGKPGEDMNVDKNSADVSDCQDEVFFGEEVKTSECTEPLTRTKARRMRRAWKKRVKK